MKIKTRTNLLLLIALTAVLLAAGLIAAPKTDNKYKIYGEYGLWITEKNGKVEVQWLTRDPEQGYLKVSVNNTELHNLNTAETRTHRAAFDAPKEKRFTIECGSPVSGFDRTEISLWPKRPAAVIKNVDSLYVIGDIHGDFIGLTALLNTAGIIDSSLHWTGGRKHLVTLGDIFDKGYDVIRCLWFLHDLENQAISAGGRVHVVLGNHEIMAMGNDLRYVSGKERVIANMYGVEYANMFDPQSSVLGRWLASKPGIIKINNIVLAHGGIPKSYADISMTAFNDSLYKFLHEPVYQLLLKDFQALAMLDTLSYYRRLAFFHGDDSVFWYRDYAYELATAPGIDYLLKKYKSKFHIVAHTPVDSIRALYEDRIIAVDAKDHLSEMLLVVRKKKKQERFRIKKNGTIVPF